MGKHTQPEKSLLLYIETRCVDNGSRIHKMHMSKSDYKILDKWTASGYVNSGDVASDPSRGENQWVTLSEDAWKDAHGYRLEKAMRNQIKDAS